MCSICSHLVTVTGRDGLNHFLSRPLHAKMVLGYFACKSGTDKLKFFGCLTVCAPSATHLSASLPIGYAPPSSDDLAPYKCSPSSLICIFCAIFFLPPYWVITVGARVPHCHKTGTLPFLYRISALLYIHGLFRQGKKLPESEVPI